MNDDFKKDYNSRETPDLEESRIFLDENKTIVVIAKGLGTQDEQKTQEFLDKFLNFLNVADGKGKVLIDGRGGDKIFSSKLRKIYVEFGKKAEAEKAAIFGLDVTQRVIALFITKVVEGKTKIKKIKIFSNKEEALKWLKEE